MLIWVVVGFVSWWATGIDDVLAFSLLLRRLPRTWRRALIAGNFLGVVLVLGVATLIVIGVLTIVPQAFEIKIVGIPLAHWAGIIPILIGGRALFLLLTHQDNDDDDHDDDEKSISARGMAAAAFIGMQIYLVNSADDLSVHLGVLGGSIKVPLITASVISLAAYWTGVLLGEITSILSAQWIAKQLLARRTLEFATAVVIMAVGILILFGVFGGTD